MVGSHLAPTPGWATAWIGIGSNIRDPIKRCRQVIVLLAQHPRMRLVGVSSWYRSEPLGWKRQPWFVNGVACIRTPLPPLALLRTLHRVEARLGRDRRHEIANGPRPMDLDLLLYNRLVWHHPRLRLPHPAMTHRRFVLQPLAEIASGLLHPGCGKSIDLLLRETDDGSRVERMVFP
ncbi:MAG: 2-amino-4-hydroxy-6-hydroxymethyldihydropteridine diphosphokinase [Magnetococcales bacterium]|nr:2-amino-4-hydroxy-6-hydroxymethyldihydropteridine diphosphokinase [Magnetococcales bacterium]